MALDPKQFFSWFALLLLACIWMLTGCVLRGPEQYKSELDRARHIGYWQGLKASDDTVTKAVRQLKDCQFETARIKYTAQQVLKSELKGDTCSK